MPRHFEIELDALRTNIIKMGSIVDEQIEWAIDAILHGNLERIPLITERDSKVDHYDNLIDAQCARIFALTQPVAVDLRLIMAALKINHELERIGDIAVNLAERATPLRGHADLLGRIQIKAMAERARRMTRLSIDSFVNNDPDAARAVVREDDVVDEMNRLVFHELVNEMKANRDLIEPATHIIIMSRHLERLADHATNIAEDVIFLVDAQIVKHPKLQPASGDA
ncbi:MAG: phosphate signaling complex protein PhoU [Ignavibacteria bacterium]|nr:phosphate signaling complex protein PhoU [Ignavibacteria bacterium]